MLNCQSEKSAGKEYLSLNTVASWSLAPGHWHVWRAHSEQTGGGGGEERDRERERERERMLDTYRKDIQLDKSQEIN